MSALKGGVQRRTGVVYHFFPHYRDGIIKELNESDGWRYVWVGADIASFDGIQVSLEWKKQEHVDAPFRMLGNVMWQWRCVMLAATARWDAVIFLANPYYLTTWMAALILKMRGIRVLFWTHGWIGEDGWIKRVIRTTFFRLADGLLLYGERAKRIAVERGFDASRVYVIYNSLDYRRQSVARQAVFGKSVLEVRRETVGPLITTAERPLVVCVARLTWACRFDLLIEALSVLKNKHTLFVNAILVGDGPERKKLECLARERGVSVGFFGACYDEETLARLFYAADVTVSPGKVGLTAVHSLMYGTPVVTHGRFDRQFPEVEAIRPGETGAFFRYDDYHALADALSDWLSAHPVKSPDVVAACVRVVDAIYNPRMQRAEIERALAGEAAYDLSAT